jgi:hypothetical protein
MRYIYGSFHMLHPTREKKEHEHYIIEMIYMLNGSVVLDLQPCSGDFGATIKPKGSRVTY